MKPDFKRDYDTEFQMYNKKSLGGNEKNSMHTNASWYEIRLL